MEDKIGTIYEVTASIVFIVGGVIMIIYRKKLLALQKSYLSKHKDYLNRKLLEGLESKSDKSNYLLTICIAIVFIVLGILKLYEYIVVYNWSLT